MSMLFYFTILKHHFINIPYHFTILLHRKTLFLLKYYFLTHSLLFLPNRSALYFPGLFNSHFYFSLPAPVQHTTHTHYTPINLSKPITTPTHTNTYINPATKPHTNTTQQQSQATHTNTNPIKNWATDQKPRPGHRSTLPINQSTPPI